MVDAAAPRWVYGFDHGHDGSPRDLADLLGGKGANLAEMTTVLSLPVPPGFTITTQACRSFRDTGWPADLDAEIDDQLERLERVFGRTFGAADDPLLLSVRSGARASMPGMLDTLLNLGLTESNIGGLSAVVGRRCALDSWRRFLLMYDDIVLGRDRAVLAALQDDAVKRAGCDGPRDLGEQELELLCKALLIEVERTNGPLPDPREQLGRTVRAVFASWDGARAKVYRKRERIDEALGTAVNVQAMVMGNRDDRSGTGVAFSRNPATGEPVAYGDFLVQAQGEDVVAGIARTEDLNGLGARFPSVHNELMEILARLEAHYRDLCDTEFTVESGRLWMLQTRVGKRTPEAAVRIAVDLAHQAGWTISKEEAVLRVAPETLADNCARALEGGVVLTVGLPASPGVATGEVCLSADRCIEVAEEGRPVLMVRPETSPDDVHGMQVAEGILTAAGGLASHAAVVARGWGIPAVVGAPGISFGHGAIEVAGVRLAEGDRLSIDGSTGEVRIDAETRDLAAPSAALEVLLEWADEISGEASGASRSAAERISGAHAYLAGHSTCE